MFNAPRPTQAYGAASSTGFGGSFVDENPLSSSTYDGLDPWSAAPSPAPPPVPQMFASAIAEATIPPVYQLAFSSVDPANAGETSVNSLSRVLATSGLPASTVERIVNLVSSRPRVSKMEFFVALALAALSQAGRDLSVEQVAQLAQKNALPEPTLDLSALGAPSTLNVHPRARAPTVYTSDDPWTTSTTTPSNQSGMPQPNTNGGETSGVVGTGLPRNWWMRQEKATITFGGQHGFILNRYMVYDITTERGSPVQRRYSEFVFLWERLVKRYPFRLLPQLPPKRISPDEPFLEQRRKGLQRFLDFVINHPVIKEDALLAAFLTEPSFEEWRKHTSITLEEESAGKRVDRVEEMTIPSDLEDKLVVVRSRVVPLIDSWQKITVLSERIIRKREAAAADLARLTNTLRALPEVQGQCWRGEDCELSDGVKQGIRRCAVHTQNHTDMLEQRTQVLLNTTLENIKSQRDLYIAMRDLFVRHDRLAPDQVERLKKRIDATSVKLDGIKAAKREGWEEEADRLSSAIEKDKLTIAQQLNRRVFIRACMWHELRVVLHNRENTLLTQTAQAFAREEARYADGVAQNWNALVESLEDMPME